MRVSRLINAVQWKYAIGEVILIVVGVTLALIANSWYEGWQQRQDELRTLQQIATALEADVNFLEGRLATLRRSEGDLAELLNRLRDDDPIDDEVQPLLKAVHTWRGVIMRSGPYEELKNRGLSLISNDILRLRLVDLYESSYGALQGASENDAVFSRDQVLPYFHTHFRHVQDEMWEPIDGYAALDSDVYFENLVSAKLGRLQGFLLPSYDEFLGLAEAVLAQVRIELDPE